MEQEIQRADRRLRRMTAVVLVLAAVLAAALVIAFHRWLSEFAAAVPTAQLVGRMRPWIGAGAIACSACLLLLAGYAILRARAATRQQRWPVQGARVLRDTRVHHGAGARKVARLLNLVALLLTTIGVAATAIAWRLFSV